MGFYYYKKHIFASRCSRMDGTWTLPPTEIDAAEPPVRITEREDARTMGRVGSNFLSFY